MKDIYFNNEIDWSHRPTAGAHSRTRDAPHLTAKRTGRRPPAAHLGRRYDTHLTQLRAAPAALCRQGRIQADRGRIRNRSERHQPGIAPGTGRCGRRRRIERRIPQGPRIRARSAGEDHRLRSHECAVNSTPYFATHRLAGTGCSVSGTRRLPAYVRHRYSGAHLPGSGRRPRAGKSPQG